MNTKSIGDYGERCAARYLRKNRYKIIERNYKTKISEIDIIATDGDCLCFVEVKTRSNTDYGLPCEAVDSRKRHQIIKGAMSYMVKHHIDSAVRFDVVEVYTGGMFKKPRINLIKNAFSTDGSR